MAEKKYGLLIDNYWCTGCHSCEVACKNELGLPVGQWGIKLLQNGPYELMEQGQWEEKFYPVLTTYCDLCEERVAKGEQPSCVLHCLASAIEFGPLDELAEKLAERNWASSILIPGERLNTVEHVLK